MVPSCAAVSLRTVLALTLGIGTTVAIDNGLGITPPRGWRSWNSYPCEDSTNTTMSGGDIISDSAMRGAMHAVLDTTRSVNGTPTALSSLGFNYVSMDDGWQQCNCSTHQDMDPTLPTCSIGDCRGGRCSWHAKSDGSPQVNPHRFPNGMKALVDYGHSLGLKVGTYLNNCICMEAGRSATHYQQDVQWMMDTGFDEVKIDNCGSSHNVTLYSELFNKTGKPIRIEDCHTSPAHPDIKSDGSIVCPMNMYRAGGDIKASFGSIIGEIYGTVPYSDRKIPLSRPGCWAYPDMLQIGNFHGEEPTRSHEERSHFSLWCIVSAPLILGFDMTNGTHMDRVWPTITNPDILMINEQWAGHPGTLVKAYPAVGLGISMVQQVPCPSDAAGASTEQHKEAFPEASSSAGWSLTNGQLMSPSNGTAPPLCMLGTQNFGTLNGAINCPPATTTGGVAQCGQGLANCSEVRGSWDLASTGALEWNVKAGPTSKSTLCLSATPGAVAKDRNPSGKGPQSTQTNLVKCPQGSGKPLANTSTFTLTPAGQLQLSDGSICLAPGAPPGVQMWAKPLLGNKVAVLVINPLPIAQQQWIPLMDVPQLPCTPTSCTARSVWAGKAVAVQNGQLDVDLASHETAVFIVSA